MTAGTESVINDVVHVLARSSDLLWELLHTESYVKDYTAALAARRWYVAAETAWRAAQACAGGYCRYVTGRSPAPEFVRETTREIDAADEMGLLALLDGVAAPTELNVTDYCRRVGAVIDRVRELLPYPAYRYPEDSFKIVALGRSIIEAQTVSGFQVFDEVKWTSPS